jgi:hypothetical protein
VGNMISRRYRYGASFIDRASGVRFEGHHPHERPDLWSLYLHEAEGRYRNFGFEGKLHLQDLEEGTGVSLFFLGLDVHGLPVAGVRCHGPLDSVGQAFLLEEMGSSPEVDMLARTIEEELPLGIVEIKGAWSKGVAATGHHLIEAIARAATHSMNWLGAEHAVAAISDTLLSAGTASGGRMLGSAAVPFPDERYRTIALSWHRSRSLELSVGRPCGWRGSSWRAAPTFTTTGPKPPTPPAPRPGDRWYSMCGPVTSAKRCACCGKILRCR